MSLAELDKTLPVTGLAMLGEEPQRFMFDFPGLLRNMPVLEQPPPGADCSPSSPSATASCGGCR